MLCLFMRGLHIPKPTLEGTGLEECDLISHSPDELLAEVAIGPLSPQETGVWNLHLRILKSIFFAFFLQRPIPLGRCDGEPWHPCLHVA